jgi:hypothetical protein
VKQRLDVPTEQNIRRVLDETLEDPWYGVFHWQRIGYCARLLEESELANEYFERALEHWANNVSNHVAQFGAPGAESVFNAATMQRLRSATDAVDWYARAALDEMAEPFGHDITQDYVRREACYWANVLGSTDPRLEQLLKPAGEEFFDAALAIRQHDDIEPALQWLQKVEPDMVNDRCGPHEGDSSFFLNRRWDWWEELQQLINASKGNPPLTIPQIREMMVDVYDRELSKRKDKRVKRPEWKCDFTKPLDIDVQPPFENAPPAKILVHVPQREGFDPEVTLYLDTTDEVWEEIGFLRVIKRGDEYEPQFIDDEGQEWILAGTFETFQEAVEYVIHQLESGDDHQQHMAKYLSFLADELTKASAS